MDETVANHRQALPVRIINGDRLTGMRLAGPDDAAFLQALFFAVKGESLGVGTLPAPVLDTLLLQQFELRNQAYRSLYPAAEQWIILKDSRPAGQFILAATAPAHRHLVDIAILPGFRGGGLATDVLTTLIADLKTMGEAQLTLSVVGTNPAMRLYRRLGFVENGRSNGISIAMVCRLAGG